MMGLGSADIRRMSLWEYESRLWHWNDAHGGDDVSPPDPDMAMRILEKANRDPRLTQGANVKRGRRA